MFNSLLPHTMLPPLTTALYAAILTFLFVGLSVWTLRQRRKLRIAIGDGGQTAMLRAIRVHANFAEYVPLCVSLMVLLELQAAPNWLLHTMGVTLCAARALHAYGLAQEREKIMFRATGVALTLAVLLTASSTLIFYNFR